MNKWGKRSLEQYQTLHPDLKLVADLVLQWRDCSILCGHRNEADQNKAFNEGHSRLKWPDGKHNSLPSNAIDLTPYPLPDWEDSESFILFSGMVLFAALQLGVKLRWGGDWDNDGETEDQTFNDLVHFELSG